MIAATKTHNTLADLEALVGINEVDGIPNVIKTSTVQLLVYIQRVRRGL
jgi:hypothetical protein